MTDPDVLISIPYDNYGDGSEGNVDPAATEEERKAERVAERTAEV